MLHGPQSVADCRTRRRLPEKSLKSWLSFQAKSLICVLFPQHSSKKIAQLLAPEPFCCAQNGVRASFGPTLRCRRTALPGVRRTNPGSVFWDTMKKSCVRRTPVPSALGYGFLLELQNLANWWRLSLRLHRAYGPRRRHEVAGAAFRLA